MGRRKKSESDTVPAADRIKVMTFSGGARTGTIQVSNPPPKYVKIAFPEWEVYESKGDEFVLVYDGLAARAWRNPIRPDFGNPVP